MLLWDYCIRSSASHRDYSFFACFASREKEVFKDLFILRTKTPKPGVASFFCEKIRRPSSSLVTRTFSRAVRSFSVVSHVCDQDDDPAHSRCYHSSTTSGSHRAGRWICSMYYSNEKHSSRSVHNEFDITVGMYASSEHSHTLLFLALSHKKTRISFLLA